MDEIGAQLRERVEAEKRPGGAGGGPPGTQHVAVPGNLRVDAGRAAPRPELRDRVESLRLPPEVSGGRGASRAVWFLCLLFAASTAVLTYLVAVRLPQTAAVAEGPEASAAADPAQAPGTPPGAPVSQPNPGAVVLEAKGYIVPARQILVSPEVSARIVELHVVEGKRVAKGEVLARLDPKDFQDDVDRAEAALEAARQRLAELEATRPEELGAAQAELAEAEAQLVQLQAEWRRAEELRRQNVLSAQDWELAESRYRAMEQRVRRLRHTLKLLEASRDKRIAAARADVQQAAAEFSKAQWRLSKCTITAPISGTILKKNAEEGNLINPIAFNGSYSLCEMANLADLEVELSIPEREIAKVSLHQKCQVRAEAYPDRVYQGYVSRLMPIADRGKGAVPVRVKVLVPPEEEGIYLKPEMGAVVAFYAEKHELRAENRQRDAEKHAPGAEEHQQQASPGAGGTAATGAGDSQENSRP